MHAIILSVGDELTLGQTIDTNSAWLSQQLATIGLPVRAHLTVPDDQDSIADAIAWAVFKQLAAVVLVTGGIGPTPDDLTRQALAEVMEQPLELREDWLKELQGFFATRGRPMPDMNRIQAMIPKGADLLWNHNGTAAGIHARLSSERPFFGVMTAADVFVMPGVPKEMKLMFERSILPTLREKSTGAVILSKSLHTFGQGESTVAELLGPLMDRSRNPSVGTTVSAGIVSVRINARFPSKDEAQRELDSTTQACHRALSDLIFAEDEMTLSQALALMLLDRSVTIATAESCTGGLLAKYLTDVPGSSAYFKQGWITYSNESKTTLLGVRPELIVAHGAVSEPAVVDMAIGAALSARADYGLAISGIAGPGGGTSDKPVGTVCIALASWDHRAHPDGESDSTEVAARRFLFPGDREMIRDRSAKMALTMLRYHLLNKPLPF